MGESSAAPWYDAAFQSDYLRVYPQRDLESARPEVAFLLERGVRGRVLDLCCGFGRHALLLREAGADVFGLDRSAELLAAAGDLPRAEQLLRGRLVRADMQSVPFAAASFDAVVNLFSSFGYLGEEGDAAVLAEIARVLRAGGLAVLDLMNPARVRAALVARSARSGPGFELVERRRLAEGGRRVIKEVELELAGGVHRRWVEDVRLYEAGELERMLARAGLASAGAWGDFDARPPGPEAPRYIACARRPEQAGRYTPQSQSRLAEPP
jgi:SAM-dependent methyltransferase